MVSELHAKIKEQFQVNYSGLIEKKPFWLQYWMDLTVYKETKLAVIIVDFIAHFKYNLELIWVEFSEWEGGKGFVDSEYILRLFWVDFWKLMLIASTAL